MVNKVALRPDPPDHWSMRKKLAHYSGRLAIRIPARAQMTAAACVAIFALLCLLMLACHSEPLHVYSQSAWTPSRTETLDDASALLGHELQPVSMRYGSVEIHWWNGGSCGDAESAAGCANRKQYGAYREVFSVEDGTILAHEIGHAFRLEHNSVEGDLMNEKGGRDTFIDSTTFDTRANAFKDYTIRVAE